MPDPEVLTVEELAGRLRIGRRAAYEAIARGDVPGVVRVGRTIRISRTAIDRWLHEAARPNGTEPNEPEDASWTPPKL